MMVSGIILEIQKKKKEKKKQKNVIYFLINLFYKQLHILLQRRVTYGA